MLGWLGTPVGRLIQGIVGMALLWAGAMQLSAVGLVVMLTGLITTVAAAVAPAAFATSPHPRVVPAFVRTRRGNVS